MPTEPHKLADLFLWLDFESTGSTNTDTVIEYAVVITTPAPYYEAVWTDTGLIKPYENSEFWNPVVAQMHGENGLISDLNDNSKFKFSRMADADDWIYNNVLRFLNREEADNPKITLAGSGVSHFDSVFLKNFFPKVWSLLSGFDNSDMLKPTLDMGIIRRFLQQSAVGIYLPTDFPEDLAQAITASSGVVMKPHRALYDVITFIEQARWLVQRLSGITDPAKEG